FARQRKWGQAVAAFSQALALKEDASVRLERAGAWVAQGHWQQAAADFGWLVDRQPDTHSLWCHTLAVLARARDQEEDCRRLRAMLARFGSTTDQGMAERTALACLLMAGVGADQQNLSRLTARVVNTDPPEADIRRGYLIRGLAEYRSGRYSQAADWSRKSLA